MNERNERAHAACEHCGDVKPEVLLADEAGRLFVEFLPAACGTHLPLLSFGYEELHVVTSEAGPVVIFGQAWMAACELAPAEAKYEARWRPFGEALLAGAELLAGGAR